MKDRFLSGCVPGSKGVAARTGYMNVELFTDEYLSFFISNTRCSKEHPILLLLDNHSSHVSLKAVEVCKSNGIHLLTLPPHCSHKLQPLDRCIYGPLKTYFSQAMDDWMRTHPGKAASIYEISQISALAFTKSMTPENIMSGFRCTGIYPLNSLIFADHEFAPASVTDQPLEDVEADSSEGIIQPDISQEEARPSFVPSMPSTSQPSTSHVIRLPKTPQQPLTSPVTLSPAEPQPSTSRVTPMQICPLPKAGPRKATNRKKKKSAILTDTPEKNRLEKEAEERKKKMQKKSGVPDKKKSVKRKAPAEAQDSSSEEEELAKELLASDSDSADEEQSQPDDSTDNIKPGAFVLAKYVTAKRSNKFYVGQVKSVNDDVYELKFMRKVKGSAASFAFPEEEDIERIMFDDIILVLGEPTSIVGTKRVCGKIMFSIDLSAFSVE